MAREIVTVEGLANAIGVESDDVLITLWDIGLEYVHGPKSQIRTQDVARSRDACGVPNGRELSRVDYWLKREGLSRDEFQDRLDELGIRLGANARTLPKGAAAKLRRSFPPRATYPQVSDAPTRRKPDATPFIWRPIGHIRDLKLLTVEEISDIHFAVADDFRDTSDPVSPAGIRDKHLLASAASRPSTSLGGERKYPTVELGAAALMHSLVHNHAFFNGNKRTALVSMLSFLDRHGLVLTCNQVDLFKWTIRVAQHKVAPSNVSGDRHDIEVSAMASWLRENSRLLDKSEKVMTWKFLRPRLKSFECEIEQSGSRGGRLNISRMVSDRDRSRFNFSRPRPLKLNVQMSYDGEGREVSKSDLRYLRRSLRLDDEHGIDSAMFYGIDSTPPDQFIAEYRKTLVRLAKL